ncbi:MAG: hypothetical protein ABI779_01005 [Acidobacteriota bacterium]
MRFFILFLVAVAAGCSPDAEQPAQTTTFLISGPEEAAANEPIEVRRFEVTPETIKHGQAVTVNVELAKPAPSRGLAIDWPAPDGWVLARDVIDAGQTRITKSAPVGDFDEPGRYRAVLRSGLDSVAEDTLSVTE